MTGPKKRKKSKAKSSANANGPFARVWAIVKRVPRGRVVTYGQLSEMIEHRLTPVGIGWAVRAAPEESIPWHRVVNSRGGVSTDREHPGLQRAMLEAEGVAFDGDGLIDLTRTRWRPAVTAGERRRSSPKATAELRRTRSWTEASRR